MSLKKRLFLPKQHGAYALTFEPLVIALLLASEPINFLLFAGAGLAFLAHPSAFHLFSAKNDRYQALLPFLLFGIPAAVLLLLFILNTGYPVYLPLFMALGIMVIYLILGLLSLDRELFTELMASVAIGLIALSMILHHGWPTVKALAFLFLLYGRSITTTIYVHYRLKLQRGTARHAAPAIVLHLVTLLIAVILFQISLIPLAGLLAIFALTVRAILGLVPPIKKLSTRTLGLLEFFYGVLFAVLVLSGYWFGA